MTFLKNKGNQLIISILILNLIIWYTSKYFYNDWFTSPFKYLAKIASLTSTLLMVFALVLSTRMSLLEYLFGGLDKVYKAHHTVARWSFTILLLHPIFLALVNINSYLDFFTYFIPNFNNQYNVGHAVGIIALIIYFVLLYITIAKKINYELWLACHSWFGALFAIIIVHILLVNGDISKYFGFSVWYNSWLIIGLVSYLWSTFFYYLIGSKYNYVIDKISKVDTFYEMELKPINKSMFYRPGQFIYTKFLDNDLPQEWHPYSIASYNNDGSMKLGIKELGDYTKQLGILKVGAKVDIKGPYGNLSAKIIIKPDKEVVLIGAGIGITPMVGIWKYILSNKRAKATLIYVSTFLPQATFDNDFVDLNNQYGIGNNDYWLYLDEGKNFLNTAMIANRVGNLDDKIFVICGPKRMMDGTIKGLKEAGVKNMNIVVEDFDFGIGNNQWFSHITSLLTK
jgi:predicted ferric reductase